MHFNCTYIFHGVGLIPFWWILVGVTSAHVSFCLAPFCVPTIIIFFLVMFLSYKNVPQGPAVTGKAYYLFKKHSESNWEEKFCVNLELIYGPLNFGQPTEIRQRCRIIDCKSKTHDSSNEHVRCNFQHKLFFTK